MLYPTPRTLLLLALALTAFSAGAQSLERTGPALDPARVPWTRLEFEARKLFMTGTSELRLTTVTRQELDGQLIASPRSAAIEPAGVATSLIELDSSFAGRRSEVKVWFEPRRAAALQRLKLRHGKKAYRKIYRFTRDGVFADRRAPRTAEESGRPADQWSDVYETFYVYPAAHPDCPVITEPTTLFYLVSAAELRSGGEPLRFCAFSGKVLSRVELRPAGTVSLDVDYVRRSPHGQDRRKGEIEVSRILVQARPVDPTAEGSFELLGLEGDVEIFIDGRVPVQVSGRIPGLGRLSVKLVAAELK